MNNAISDSRRGLRTATAIGAVSLGLLALSACEKPTPLTTVTVGTDTVNTEAACYAHGDPIESSEAKKCLEKKAEQSISAGKGDKIRFGVEPDMAETGWMLFIDGRPVLPEPIDKTYYSFPADAFFQQSSQPGRPSQKPPKSVQVSVVETADGEFHGVWQLRVERDK